MEKDLWIIYYHHSFYGDVVEGTFADAVRAGINRVEKDFEGAPTLAVRTGYGCPGIDYQEKIEVFNSPLDLIAEIERYPEDNEEDDE